MSNGRKLTLRPSNPRRSLGDRRGSNPRHLEPQGEDLSENLANPGGPVGQEGRAAAVAFLSAARAGEDRAVDLAVPLAQLVLGAEPVQLAQGVLEGGPLVVTRAVRLAEHILAETAPGVRAREGAS